MPANPVRDIRRSGTLATKSSTTAGPADEFSSSVTITPSGIVVQEDNNGTAIAKRHGDGRQWMPIQLSQPGTLTNGQFWIEKIGATSYIRFVDHNGAIVSLTSGSPAPPSVTTVALTTPSTTYTLDSVNCASAGAVMWHVALADLVGGRRAIYLIHVVHNGTTAAAATDTAISVIGGASIGSPAIGGQVVFSTGLTGSFGSQTMQLTAVAGASGIVAEVLRSYMVAG